jgi:hypothetical protein
VFWVLVDVCQNRLTIGDKAIRLRVAFVVSEECGAEVMNSNMYDKAIACRYRYFSCNDVFAIRSISEKKADDGLIQDSISALLPRRSKLGHERTREI